MAVKVDLDLLRVFENGLDLRRLERSAVPARILGYGEISTVLDIEASEDRGLAFKRLPMFESEQEAETYSTLYSVYESALRERAGLHVAVSKTRWFTSDRGRVVLYIVQEKFDSAAIGHHVVRGATLDQARFVVRAVLREAYKVFAFNREHRGNLEMGLDAQISNWAIDVVEGDEIQLVYLDTSTPLMRQNGQEQLNPDLFLRSAPSFLVWVIRRLFLPEVMTRYYDFRRVAMDLVANLYKEQRSDLVPPLVDVVNEFLCEQWTDEVEPLTVSEVRGYYREDAIIWRFYLAARKIDRRLYRMRGREYPYILPERIKR